MESSHHGLVLPNPDDTPWFVNVAADMAGSISALFQRPSVEKLLSMGDNLGQEVGAFARIASPDTSRPIVYKQEKDRYTSRSTSHHTQMLKMINRARKVSITPLDNGRLCLMDEQDQTVSNGLSMPWPREGDPRRKAECSSFGMEFDAKGRIESLLWWHADRREPSAFEPEFRSEIHNRGLSDYQRTDLTSQQVQDDLAARSNNLHRRRYRQWFRRAQRGFHLLRKNHMKQ